ncbi:MAG: hypothetical protein R3C17_04335 [Planctomycetaceae bacterium]
MYASFLAIAFWGLASISNMTGFGASIFGTKSHQQISLPADYEGLVIEIVKFFRTRQPLISEAETIANFAFIEAADESKRHGGVPVTLESVMTAARQESDGAE